MTEQTAEPKAERTLESAFRYLLEHVGDACFILARDSSFIEVNQRACDSLGYTREELLALSGPDIDLEWDLTRFAEFYDRMVPGVAVGAFKGGSSSF